MTILPHEFELFGRLPALLADADDVLGFVIFIVIGAVMLIFKAIASTRGNGRQERTSRQEIARSIRASRPEIQGRAEEIRRQRMAAAGTAPANESLRDRRYRLQRQRLLERQGRAADARTEYDLIRQRRQAEQMSPEALAEFRSPEIPQVKRTPPSAARPAPPVQRRQPTPQFQAHPQALYQAPRQAQLPPRQPAANSRPPMVARATSGSTAPVTATAVTAGGIGKRAAAAPARPPSLAAALRRRMSGNQLREYMVAAEVLGKPIALREPGST